MKLGTESVDIAWGYEASRRFDFINNGWKRLAGGKLVAADRGTTFDKLRAKVKANLPVAEFEDFIAYIASESANDSLSCELGAGEEIFGCEIDYTNPYLVHLEGISDLQVNRDNPAFGSATLSLLLAAAPVLLGTAANWGALTFPFEDDTKYGMQAGSVVPMGQGATRFLDGQEGRTYSATFELCQDSAKAVKAAAIASRAAAVTLPTMAYKRIFGADSTGANSAVVLQWGAEVRTGLNIWEFPITFAKQY